MANRRRMSLLLISLPRGTTGAVAAGPDSVAGPRYVRTAAQALPGWPVGQPAHPAASAQLRLVRREGQMTAPSAGKRAPVHLGSLWQRAWASVRAAASSAGDQHAVGQDEHVVAGQLQCRAIAAGDAGSPLSRLRSRMESANTVTSRAGEAVKEPVEQQKFWLVHGGGGQPGPPGDRVRRGAQRHLGPGRQREPVQDGRGEDVPVAAVRPGDPGGVLD